MMGELVSLFPEEERHLFMEWRLSVRKHGTDSREAFDAWTAFIMSFIPIEDRPAAMEVFIERMGGEA